MRGMRGPFGIRHRAGTDAVTGGWVGKRDRTWQRDVVQRFAVLEGAPLVEDELLRSGDWMRQSCWPSTSCPGHLQLRVR